MTTLLLSVFFAISASAYKYEVDGIYYNLNNSENTAEVARNNYSKDIKIPSSIIVNGIEYTVTSISDDAFLDCYNLTSITIPNSVTSIRDRAFYGCSGLTSITIPNSVTSIGEMAFYGCSGLTSITIPNSVTSIGYLLLEGCDGIKNTIIVNDMFVYLPTTYSGNYAISDNVTTIIGGAFSGCSGLTSITIPNSVTSIGERAFSNCSGLTSITIPNSVTSIGNNAFSGCSGLTSITIPNSVTTIISGAFFGCSGLTSITIPNSVTSIGYDAFYGCSGLTSITIPNSVTSIGGGAFSNCSGLTSITIPNSVTSIGESAFQGCSNLTTITIPNPVTSIGKSAFSGCSNLTSITIPNSVTSIGDYAFSGCSGLTLITIPNSVKSIGESAFSGCSGLTSITIPNSVTSIGDYAFSGCSGVTSITIPNSVSSIGIRAFKDCSGLTSITIPNSVTSIGYFLLEGCDGIKNTIIVNDMFVYLPKTYSGNYSISDNVTTIIGGAFYGCSGLTSITIPNSVTSIGGWAFSNCNIEKLYFDCSVNPYISSHFFKELTIGDNLTIVHDYFKDAHLTKIVLGKKVSQLRAEAFKNSQLKEFSITGEEPPYLYPNVFGSQDLSKATLYVPESKVEYYQTTEPWSNFGKVLTLSGETPAEPKKCATPSISYSDGKLQFSCETEGAKCNYTVSCPDAASGETSTENNSVTLNAYYDITCYAKAEGFANSDVATAKLYWLTSSGSLETNINTAETRGVMASSANGFVTLSGLNTDEQVSFYTADGRELGTVKAIDGTTHFAAQSGTVVIAKIGKESLKISIK